MADKPVCKFDGCSKPAKGRGWCGAHWKNWRKYGDPTPRRSYQFRGDRSCSQCDTKNPRTIEFFGPKKGRPDGLESYCRECHARKARIAYHRDPEKRAQYKRRYLSQNRDRINAERRERYGDHEKKLERAWRAANRDKTREIYRRSREKRSPEQRFSHAVGNRVREVLRLRVGKDGDDTAIGYKNESWQTAFGYTKQELCRHIERQFTSGMTWRNFGTFWHLDHIVPLASFSYTGFDDPEFKAAWALTNLRPLEKFKNIQKHAKRTHLL